MGFVSDLFSSDKGAGYQAQSANTNAQTQGPAADLRDPLSGEAQNGLFRSNDSLNSQAQLVNALRSQNGLQNQNDLYNQYGQIAQGRGPNPAQAQLAQATAQNVAQQTALMGSQRGASANPALLARQAAQQGAQIQQNAANQSAVLQAQQQLNALGAQSQIANQQAGNLIGTNDSYAKNSMAQQGQLIGANVAANQGAIQNAQQQNAANSGIAQLNAQGQQNMFGKVLGSLGIGGVAAAPAPGANGGMVMAAEGGQIVPPQNPYHALAPLLSGENFFADGGIVDFGSNKVEPSPMPNPPRQSSGGSGIDMAQIAKLAPLLAAADGGIVDFTSGNPFNPNASYASRVNTDSESFEDAYQDGQDFRAALKKKYGSSSDPATSQGTQTTGELGHAHTLPRMEAHGGRVPAILSPGEKVIDAPDVPKVARGEVTPLKAGHTVPGKPKVGGAKNTYANDTVPMNLEAGSIVLPRSVTQSKNPSKEAAKFVEALLSKQKKGAK